MTIKQAIDQTGLQPDTAARLAQVDKEQSLNARGIGGDPILEPVPEYIRTSNDKVLENGHNAWIILGRDRPKSRLSGFGGAGHTHCASIDLVAGRMGYQAKTFISGKRVWVDPDFEKDAARIYISQKTNVDENFGLAKGIVGMSKTKSAIGIKADAIRIVAREGIKIVTGVDKKNSQGGNVTSKVGIDLIAGNDDKELQPMAKGDNLREGLSQLANHLDKLNGIVDSLLQYQMTFNEALTHHFHFSPFFGLPTSPSPPVVASGIKTMLEHLTQTKLSLVTHKANVTLWKHNYLSVASDRYILSRYNNNN